MRKITTASLLPSRIAKALTADLARRAHLARWAGLLGALLGVSLPPPAARAQTPPPAVFTTLHSFSATTNGTNTEGTRPEAGLLIGLDGNFYGTAEEGGPNGNGTVFRCTPNGTVSVVHPFNAGDSLHPFNADGASPEAALIQDAVGNLYGTTGLGGVNGLGTAFEVTLAGGFTDLHDFGSAATSADGESPRSSLLLTPDGLLVGTAGGGGDSNGTFFFLDGTNFGPVLNFGGSLGSDPGGSLAYSNPPGAEFPTIYGACAFGGNGSGVIFGVPGAEPGGSLLATYTFSALDSSSQNADGAEPFGGVIAGSDGNLYGTTVSGGPSGNGTVWQIVVDPNSGAASLNVLHAFAGSDAGDGSESDAPLVEGSDGSFYGTTYYGGAAGTGVVFRVTTGKEFTVLHAFSAVDNNTGDNSDGESPVGGLVEVRPGSFVGTAFKGGVNGSGTIYEVDVPPVITSAATAAGNVGIAFSYQITAADSPGSFSVSGLSEGLTFNDATGLISGVPTTAGTLKLTLYASNDAGTGSKALTVTIKEATLEFSASAYSVNEAAGSLTVHVARSSSSAGAVSVVCATSSGTAKSGTDYTGRSQTLSWAAGDTAQKAFTVAIKDLKLTDGSTRSIHVALSNATGSATLGSPATATITIHENDPAGTLAFLSSTASVAEDAGSETIHVTRTGGSVGAVSATCETFGSTAKSGTDYTGTTQTLSWKDGDAAEKSFTIALKDPGVTDGSTRTFTAKLASPTGNATLGSPSTNTITINESDPPQGELEFASSSYSVNETGGTVTVHVDRTVGTTGAVSVTCGTESGTATSGKDYTGKSETLGWAAGDMAAKSFAVSILNRGASGGHGLTFSLKLSAPTGNAILGSPATATVTINQSNASAH